MTTTPLEVVHVGQSAIVLRDQVGHGTGNALLVVTSEMSGLMPGGICLRADDFRRIRNTILSRELFGSVVLLDGWDGRSTTADPVDLLLRYTPIPWKSVLVHELALHRVAFAGSVSSVMSPVPIRQSAPAFARQAIAGRLRTETLRAMIGAGPGTTPSGDDIIVGVLAGLRVLGLGERSAELSRRVTPLIPATTAASRHYLSAAIEGRFGEHVHQLVAALAGGDSTERTLGSAADWGATSGIDLLVGLVTTLVTSLNSQSIESAA
ncbi:MAG: DUF2877 domain-containing protein [Lacisediminihabitans sp.]